MSVGPDSLGIDGDDIPWRSVTAVRTSAVSGLLGRRLVADELDRVKKLVPPVPGRSIVLGQVATVLGALLERALVDGDAPRGHIVSAVESTGRLGRQRTTQLGLAGALVLMAMPDVDRSIRATAEQHGVPIMGLPTVGGEAPLSPASFRRLVGDDLGGQGPDAGAPS